MLGVHSCLWSLTLEDRHEQFIPTLQCHAKQSSLPPPAANHMFSCSRNCLSHRVTNKVVAKGCSRACEPLLFLYPTWYRDHIKRLHQAATARERDGDINQDRETGLGR